MEQGKEEAGVPERNGVGTEADGLVNGDEGRRSAEPTGGSPPQTERTAAGSAEEEEEEEEEKEEGDEKDDDSGTKIESELRNEEGSTEPKVHLLGDPSPRVTCAYSKLHRCLRKVGRHSLCRASAQ